METSSSQDGVHKALVELYLSVKVRSAEEIESYTQEKLEEELQALKSVECLLLVAQIREVVETVLAIKAEEARVLACDCDSEVPTKEVIKAYEEQLQSLEAEIRVHIAVINL